MQQTQTQQHAELVCPFHSESGDCGFKTVSESEYADHTVQHIPNGHVLSDGLVKARVACAKDYAGIGKGKTHPAFVAAHLWADKPAKMDCSQLSAVIQDFGITDNDNFAGLTASTDGTVKRSVPYHNPFLKRRGN